jgi:hypothetical protein
MSTLRETLAPELAGGSDNGLPHWGHTNVPSIEMKTSCSLLANEQYRLFVQRSLLNPIFQLTRHFLGGTPFEVRVFIMRAAPSTVFDAVWHKSGMRHGALRCALLAQCKAGLVPPTGGKAACWCGRHTIGVRADRGISSGDTAW